MVSCMFCKRQPARHGRGQDPFLLLDVGPLIVLGRSAYRRNKPIERNQISEVQYEGKACLVHEKLFFLSNIYFQNSFIGEVVSSLLSHRHEL